MLDCSYIWNSLKKSEKKNSRAHHKREKPCKYAAIHGKKDWLTMNFSIIVNVKRRLYTLIQTTLDSSFLDELKMSWKVIQILKHLIATKRQIESTALSLQSLIDKQIFFCVMNRPFGVVILKPKKKDVVHWKLDQDKSSIEIKFWRI